jgi:hypothetical protein
MTDWKALARARQLNIPEPEVERLAAPLDALEAAFRPLARALPHDVEPAIVYRAGDEA